MDLDTFEKEQEARIAKKGEESTSTALVRRYGSGQAGSADGTAQSILSSWEEEAQREYDAYMFMGAGGGRRERDHFGFHLPHRKRNEL